MLENRISGKSASLQGLNRQGIFIEGFEAFRDLRKCDKRVPYVTFKFEKKKKKNEEHLVTLCKRGDMSYEFDISTVNFATFQTEKFMTVY